MDQVVTLFFGGLLFLHARESSLSGEANFATVLGIETPLQASGFALWLAVVAFAVAGFLFLSVYVSKLHELSDRFTREARSFVTALIFFLFLVGWLTQFGELDISGPAKEAVFFGGLAILLTLGVSIVATFRRPSEE